VLRHIAVAIVIDITIVIAGGIVIVRNAIQLVTPEDTLTLTAPSHSAKVTCASWPAFYPLLNINIRNMQQNNNYLNFLL